MKRNARRVASLGLYFNEEVEDSIHKLDNLVYVVYYQCWSNCER